MAQHKYSQWYPYLNTQESYNNLSQLPELPRMLCDYLLDAPNGDYTPVDDNEYARCRFWKYLFYDEAKPLTKKLPTIKEKMSILFDPNKPETPPTKKGYRLYPQIWVKQSQTEAQTRVYVYKGRTVPNDDFKSAIAIHFVIFSHYTYELNTKATEYDRLIGIEQAIIEAFNGVNMTGVGTFFYSKRKHPDCGSRPIYDKDINVGIEVVLGLELATTYVNDLGKANNMPLLSSTMTTRLA
uniref:Uncharacterized protein n=1 Tax=Siphoviridae sp. ctnMR5 TaxID=2825658 RepID=A0A8S5U906_9CAUD|nr:MAG TPA: hypothetical protein [Siphoviridae sp. ctnMR5]